MQILILMEVDIMEHLVPLRNSVILLISFTVLSGCNTNAPENAMPVSTFVLNKTEQQISMSNGLLFIDKRAFNGTLFTLYPKTKDTAAIENYLNGKEHGEWRKFYSSTKIKEKRFFTNGKKTGEYIAWWENGSKQLHYHFDADEYEGTCKEWSENGFLNRVMNYKKGHEDGHQLWWYDNGKIKANYIIKDGRRYGLLGTKNCINVSDSIFKN
jgi:antitoxin component YwqK of YwqJK toxin-antitoxin module